jgi:eukaryotic-like serine/threonine-protein kinase
MESDTPRRLKIEHVRVHGGCLIRLSGVVDETLDKELFLSKVEGVVVIDLDGVTRITSYGVREWLSALQQLKATWLGFVKCRPAMVSQFNMVPNFGRGGKILSLYLPYICPKTAKTFDVLADVRKQHAELSAYRLPDVQCPEGDGPAEFDDMPDVYLGEVAAQGRPDAPPLVDQLLGANPGEAWGGLRVLKDVYGAVTGLWLVGRLDERDHFRRIADGLEGVLYISCEGVTAVAPAGVSRFIKFLDEVTIPVLIDQLPLEIAERLAVDPMLPASVEICSITVHGRCPLHGSVKLALLGEQVLSSAQGRPLLLFCPECEQICHPEFNPTALQTAARLRVRPITRDVERLIRARDARLAEHTTTQRPLNFTTGTIVLGRYELVRALGAGGMAEVFLARQTGVGGFDRQVVVKRILPGLAVDESFVAMFLTEAKLAARLSHPNVVQIFDVGEDNGQYFIVMEYVRGCDLNIVLKACVRANTPCPPPIAARLVADVARGLSAAHRHVDPDGKPQSIVHRDVSPHNVMVSSDGFVKLTDFGIAKAAGSVSVTPSAVLKGKAAYMAPELIQKVHAPADGRVDIFAAGLIFYQLVTLKHPFRRDSELDTFNALINQAAPPPSTLVTGVPASVDEICRHVLAKDPADRYATAQDFEQDLEAFITSTGTSAGTSDVAKWLTTIPLPAEGAAHHSDTTKEDPATVATVSAWTDKKT